MCMVQLKCQKEFGMDLGVKKEDEDKQCRPKIILVTVGDNRTLFLMEFCYKRMKMKISFV